MLAVVVALPATAACAQSAADKDKRRAARLLDEGVSKFEAGDYAAALDRFETAYRAFPSPKILLNIGQAQRRLGREEEAAWAYDKFLTETASARDVGDAKIASARAALAELLPRLGRIRLEVEPGESSLAVDGRTVGSARDVRTVYVKPGKHTIVAEAKDRLPHSEGFEVGADEEKRIAIRLEEDRPRPAAPPTAAAAPAAPAPPPPREPPRHRLVTWVAAGGAVALAGAGAFFGVRAGNAYDDLKQASAADDRAAYDDARPRVTRNATLANVCFAAAAGAAVVAGVLFVFEGRPAEGAERSIALSPRWDAAGIDLGVRF